MDTTTLLEEHTIVADNMVYEYTQRLRSNIEPNAGFHREISDEFQNRITEAGGNILRRAMTENEDSRLDHDHYALITQVKRINKQATQDLSPAFMPA